MLKLQLQACMQQSRRSNQDKRQRKETRMRPNRQMTGRKLLMVSTKRMRSSCMIGKCQDRKQSEQCMMHTVGEMSHGGQRDLLTLSHYDLVLSSTIYGFGYSHNTRKVKGKQPENLEQSNTLGKISVWGCFTGLRLVLRPPSA